jgi:hypothetical protein
MRVALATVEDEGCPACASDLDNASEYGLIPVAVRIIRDESVPFYQYAHDGQR